MFLVAMTVVTMGFVAAMYLSGLQRYRGTQLRTRIEFEFVLSLLVTVCLVWAIQGRPILIVRALALGAVLSVPFSVQNKHSIDHRLRGSTIFYRGTYGLRNALWAIALTMFAMLFTVLYVGFRMSLFGQLIWPLLGFGVAWLAARAFALVYVLKLERKLGAAILEDQLASAQG